MLTLYHHNISVCAQKVRIALDEKRIPWQGREVDLMKGEHLTPEFLKINPRIRRRTRGRNKFFWGAVSINFEKRCNHYRLILACMLSGVSRDRPVIVGWSTAPRGQVIEESLGQLPKKLAAGPRVLARTESLRTQSGTKQGGPPHDHWAKLGQLRYTRSLYAFVVIALF